MPKAVVSPSKGLVQSSGSGFGIAGTNNGPGLYHFVREIDFNGIALAGNDDDAVAGVCELPASAVIKSITCIVTEVFAAQQTNLTLTAVAAQASGIGADLASTTDLVSLGDVKVGTIAAAYNAASIKEAANGMMANNAGAVTSALISSNALIAASKPYVYLAEGAGSNSSTAHATGKILIHIEYYAAEAATELNL